jgi:glycosyltransferase involved in cell wall biosynthesis
MFLGDKILSSNSAYSKIGYETCTRLAKLGYKVAHTPIGKVNQMGIQTFEDVLVYPSGADPFAEDIIGRNYAGFNADMLITIKEPWCFQRLHAFALNYVPFAVIDHSPVSTSITSRLLAAFKVIALTRFGQRELQREKINSVYIPHGVQTEVFKPLDRAKCRKLWFLGEDEFVVGIVAMNRARKMIPRMFRGYKRFRELNPDVKSHLMLWTDVYPSRYPEEALGVSDVGSNLLPEIMALGLGEDIRWPAEESIMQGIPEWTNENDWNMVTLYNTMDCLLLCSGGEGFGLPLIEAQSCGMPVVTTDYAGGPENVGCGLVVPWDDYVIYDTPGVRRPLANIDKMAEALSKIMNSDRAKLASKARAFALRYDWNKVIQDYWVPFLKSCEEELHPLLTKDGRKSW